ncbi:hypothetical protein PAXINDRAFT_167551, partial [Paxillus involutus ATCC 200175]
MDNMVLSAYINDAKTPSRFVSKPCRPRNFVFAFPTALDLSTSICLMNKAGARRYIRRSESQGERHSQEGSARSSQTNSPSSSGRGNSVNLRQDTTSDSEALCASPAELPSTPPVMCKQRARTLCRSISISGWGNIVAIKQDTTSETPNTSQAELSSTPPVLCGPRARMFC